jgi:alpha/beta hydrolase fold
LNAVILKYLKVLILFIVDIFMTYNNKRHQNTLALVVFTYSVMASLLIINSNTLAHSLRVDAANSTASKNTQSSPTINTLIPTIAKKVHVGDIDIAYKIFGKGNPVLLIAGTSATMDFWDPFVLRQLSANHTVIVFDNRGMGNTTSGNRPFSISQFANDTAGLLDALKIREPVDVMGHSLGSFIAQELALMHPDKVNFPLWWQRCNSSNPTSSKKHD